MELATLSPRIDCRSLVSSSSVRTLAAAVEVQGNELKDTFIVARLDTESNECLAMLA